MKRTDINKEKRDQWVDAVMSSIDGIARAEANPFLYTRIMARISEAHSGWERAVRVITRPAFAVAAVAIFLAINLWVALQDGKPTEAQLQEAEQVFAAEYNPVNYQLIEINPDK